MRFFIGILYLLLLNIHVRTEANDIGAWQQVKDVSLLVSEDSPLNFSRFIEAGPAGKFGNVIINKNGRMAFSKSHQNTAFNCASLAWSPATGGFPDHQQADIYAHQLRVYGYNIVRFHYVDALLMSGRDTDFDFDPEQLDRWFYFLAALKREGIYWVMDAMSSGNGAYGGVYPHRWVKKYGLHLRLYTDVSAQQHWKELVKKLLVVKNPYTQIRTIEDPALVGIVLINENGLNFQLNNTSDSTIQIQKDFNDWLIKKYATTEKLQLSWQDLTSTELLKNKSILLPNDLGKPSARMTDMQKYIVYKQEDMAVWMTAFLRTQGFKGLVTAFHDSQKTSDNVSRDFLPWVDMHNYQDHGSSWSVGATIAQSSSLSNFGGYMRVLAVTRIAGKPFSLTEYGQPFWNRYRYEAAPIAASMASLQDWDFICLHASGIVDLSLQQKYKMKASILPYGGGVDPIVRAGETLSSLLMLRRDIEPAKHTIRIPLSTKSAFERSGVGEMRDFSKLAWLTKIELLPESRSKDVTSSILYLKPTPQVMSEILPNIVKAIPMLDLQVMDYIDILRKKHFLSAGNQSSIAKGVLHSDTEQILIDQKEGAFQIVTPRTEALVSNKPSGYRKLDVLIIKQLSVDGLLAVSALDDKPLATSEKILLIFATDAENTDMKFADSQRKKLINIGQMPPRIRFGTVEARLNIRNNHAYVLYSLHLNGDLGDKLSLKKDKTGVTFNLNNVALTHGPTTYFMLVKQ